MQENRRIKINIRMGMILSYLTIIVGIIVTIFYTPFLISKVGKVEHGIHNFVNSIISWMSILTVGFAGAYVRFATKYNKEEGEEGLKKINSAFIYVLLIGAAIGILAGIVLLSLIYSGVISLQGYSSSEKQLIYKLFIIGIINLLFQFATIFFNAFNTYKNNFILVRGIALAISIFSPIFTIPFLIKGYGILSVSIVKFFIDLIALIVYFFFSFISQKIRFIKIREFAEKKEIIKEILIFCLYIIFYVTVETITQSSEKIILGFMGLPTLVSIFALGRAFLVYTHHAAIYISANYIQIINDKIMSKKHDEVNDLFIKLSKAGLLMTFFIFGGFLVTGDVFVRAWLENSVYTFNEMKQIYWIAVWLMFAYIIPFSQTSAIEIQRGYNKHRVPTIILLISAIFNMSLMILLVKLLPSEYIILGTLLSTVFTTLVTQGIVLNIYYKKVLKLDIRKYFMCFIRNAIITFIPILICVLIFKLAIDLTQFMNMKLVFLIEGMTFVVLYVSVLYFFERELVTLAIKKVFRKLNRKLK